MRIRQLMAMSEIPPDLAADTEERLAGKLTERQAVGLIMELGGHIAWAREVGKADA